MNTVCPRCQESVNLNPDQMGLRLRCPNCSGIFICGPPKCKHCGRTDLPEAELPQGVCHDCSKTLARKSAASALGMMGVVAGAVLWCVLSLVIVDVSNAGLESWPRFAFFPLIIVAYWVVFNSTRRRIADREVDAADQGADLGAANQSVRPSLQTTAVMYQLEEAYRVVGFASLAGACALFFTQQKSSAQGWLQASLFFLSAVCYLTMIAGRVVTRQDDSRRRWLWLLPLLPAASLLVSWAFYLRT